MKIDDTEVSKLAKIRNYKIALGTLAKQVSLQVGQLGGGMPLNQLAVFFEVARTQALGIYPTTTDIRLKLDLDRRAVSRYLLALGEQGYGSVEGMHLIEFVENTSDKRVKRIALTRKGEELALNLAHHLQELGTENLNSITDLSKGKLSDCLCMLGADPDIPLNIYVVRKPYNLGLYSFMRHRMAADIPEFGLQNPSLVILERKLDVPGNEITKMIDNLSLVHITDRTQLFVWLASNENPPGLVAKLNRRAKRQSKVPVVSFFDTFDEVVQALGMPNDWTLPELTSYE